MIFVDELLQPITEGNPSGAYLRSDPVYDAIKEVRREEAGLAAQARSTPLNQAGHSWHCYIQGDPAGSLQPIFPRTPMAFYLELEQQLDASLINLAALTVGQVTQDLLAKKRTELP